MYSKLVATACLSLGAMAFGTAHGATLCTSNIETLVPESRGCEYTTSSPTNNGEQTVLDFVNGQNFFGLGDDWMYGGQLSGTGQNGTWNLSGLTGSDTWENVMLIFKSGEGTGLVGYWLNDGAMSGTWASPFREPPFDFQNGSTIRDVSYIRVFFAPGEDGGEVPEPATLALLGFGLVGLALTRRRRPS